MCLQTQVRENKNYIDMLKGIHPYVLSLFRSEQYESIKYSEDAKHLFYKDSISQTFDTVSNLGFD